MKHRILRLILFGIILIRPLSFVLASDFPSSRFQESVNQQDSVVQSSAITKYLIGVAEYNEGNVELAKDCFHEAWKSLESEKEAVNIQRVQAFQRALSDKYPLVKSAKVRFPEGYKVNVYYRDGWFTQPKDLLGNDKYVYSFLAGSTYRVRVETESKHATHQQKENIGMKLMPFIVIMSWLIAR